MIFTLSVIVHIVFLNLGYTYQFPIFLTYGTASAKSFLAGSYYFKPIEIQVYTRNS